MTEERKDYLQSLAEDYDVDLHTVLVMASMLGENEDHDGLITALADYTGSSSFMD